MNTENLLGKIFTGCSIKTSGSASKCIKKELKENPLQLYGDQPAKEINFSQIRKSRTVKEDLNTWLPLDFVHFVKSLLSEIPNAEWRLKVGSSCYSILQIKDCLVDAIGFCDNQVLKDYITFFFDKHVERFVKKYKNFFFKQMLYSNIISEFANNYKYKPDKSVASGESVSIDDMDNAFALGDEVLVKTYGLVLSVNWLMKKMSYSFSDATKLIYLSSKKVYDAGKFSLIKEVTEKFNPYPTWLCFFHADQLAKKIDNELNVLIQVSKDADSRFTFLRSS